MAFVNNAPRPLKGSIATKPAVTPLVPYYKEWVLMSQIALKKSLKIENYPLCLQSRNLPDLRTIRSFKSHNQQTGASRE